jgi:hypothetical protein
MEKKSNLFIANAPPSGDVSRAQITPLSTLTGRFESGKLKGLKAQQN